MRRWNKKVWSPVLRPICLEHIETFYPLFTQLMIALLSTSSISQAKYLWNLRLEETQRKIRNFRCWFLTIFFLKYWILLNLIWRCNFPIRYEAMHLNSNDKAKGISLVLQVLVQIKWGMNQQFETSLVTRSRLVQNKIITFNQGWSKFRQHIDFPWRGFEDL